MTEPTGALRNQPGPYFGEYGGRFMPESLIAAIDEITAAFEASRVDPELQAELAELHRTYTGRPSIITEAARGIYDKQILSALPALAAALDRSEIPVGLRQEGFLRRAIEANYRIGRAEDAERVAKAAAMGADSGMPDTSEWVM